MIHHVVTPNLHRTRQHRSAVPDRLAGRVAWLGRLAGFGLSAAAMATLWMMLKLSGYGFFNVVVAGLLCRAYWIAAALFAALYASGLLWRRLARGPARPGAAPQRLTGDARRADLGRGAIAWYMVGGFGLLAIFSMADRGPFASATEWLRPTLGGATPLAGFVLGLGSLVFSLVLLGRLPRLAGWPMLTAAQDMVRRRPKPGRARRRGGPR